MLRPLPGPVALEHAQGERVARRGGGTAGVLARVRNVHEQHPAVGRLGETGQLGALGAVRKRRSSVSPGRAPMRVVTGVDVDVATSGCGLPDGRFRTVTALPSPTVPGSAANGCSC